MSEPKEWKDMPDGIKGMIVKQLDLPARTRFKMCSKADKRLVDSIPFEVDKVNAYDWYDKPWKEYYPVYYVKILTVIITNSYGRKPEDECSASISLDNKTSKREFKFSNVAQAKKFVADTFAQILIHGNIHIKELYTSISCSEEFKKTGFKIKAKNVEIGPFKVEDTMNWLQHLDPCVEEIHVSTEFDQWQIHSGVGLIPEVINAKKFSICTNNDINDKQIVAFKATELFIGTCVFCVTEKGLNMLMKKWIAEDYPIGSKMEFWFEKLDSDLLLNGLDYETISGSFREINGRVVINHEKELIIKRGSHFTAEVCPIQEHKMTNWNNLPYELKWMIVERTSLITRTNLTMCSKSDKRLVEKVPFRIGEMLVCQLYRNNAGNAGEMTGLLICFGSLKIESRHSVVTFTNKITGKQRVIELASQNQAIKMVKDMFTAFVAPGNLKIERFITDWHIHKSHPVPVFKLHVTSLELCVNNKERPKWLEKTTSELKNLRICGDASNGCDIGMNPIIRNLKVLVVEACSVITDKQLLNLNATTIGICESKITATGINQLIKKMIDKDYPIGSEMAFTM